MECLTSLKERAKERLVSLFIGGATAKPLPLLKMKQQEQIKQGHLLGSLHVATPFKKKKK